MDWLAAAALGGLGGFSIEALDFIHALKSHGALPWQVGPDPSGRIVRRPDLRPGEENLPAPGGTAYAVAVALGVFVSSAVAGVMAATYAYAAVPAVSFILGMNVRGILDKLTKVVPLQVAEHALRDMEAARPREDEPAPQPRTPAVEPAPEPAPRARTEPALVPAAGEAMAGEPTPAGPGEPVTEGTTP
ncbi:hypothetical protein [Kitasatospora terrestris]